MLGPADGQSALKCTALAQKAAVRVRHHRSRVQQSWAGVPGVMMNLTMALKGCIKGQCVCRCQRKRVTAYVIAYSSMEDSSRTHQWELLGNCNRADVIGAQACLLFLGLHCRQSCMWLPAHHLQIRSDV